MEAIDTEVTEAQIDQELARRHIREFIDYTFRKFDHSWFSDLVCEKVEAFLEDCAQGRSPRLMIFAPPRHGKSEIVSRRLPAYALGRYPDMHVISASYSSTLAGRMSRDVNRVVGSTEYREVFPRTRFDRKGEPNPDEKSNTIELREVIGGAGSYRAAGIGEGITGQGANILLIDDPIKSAKEANSETVRESVWEWYLNDAYTRLEPGGGILIVLTRWHADDLAGRLLDAAKRGEGDDFEVLSFPAIAEEDEYHPETGERLRKAGKALLPRRYPLKRLKAIRKAVGEYVWNALYQQRPSTKGGSVFKGAWWQSYKVLPRFRWRAVFADTAQKTKERNDYSVMQHWGYSFDNRLYLIDQIRGKWEAPELLVHAKAFWAKVGPADKEHKRARAFYIEDKASGTGLIQQLQREGGIPVQGIPRAIDKATRALDAAPHVEAGNVFLPESAPWLSDFLFELEAFTLDDSHAHDDQFDPLCDAINEAFGGAGNLYAGIDVGK